MVWTCEERRARAQATSTQHDSTSGKTKRKTTAKIYMDHPDGYESE